MTAIVVPIEGMTCQGCVAAAQRAVARVPGVAAATVRLEAPAQATVTAATGATAEALRPAVVAAIRQAGFRVPGAG